MRRKIISSYKPNLKNNFLYATKVSNVKILGEKPNHSTKIKYNYKDLKLKKTIEMIEIFQCLELSIGNFISAKKKRSLAMVPL